MLFIVLGFSGCATNQPDLTIMNMPNFDIERKTCTNEYSPLDLLPYGLLISGVAELIYTCEDFVEYEESPKVNQRLEDRV